MNQDIPGTITFDGDLAHKVYALNRMCFSLNSAENRAVFTKDEDAYCRKFSLTEQQCAAMKLRNRPAIYPSRWQRLLSREIRRHFRPRRSGYRCPANQHDSRRIQSQARGGREINMARIIGGVATTHVPSIGKAIAAEQAERPVLETVLESSSGTIGWPARSPTSRWCSTTTTA